MAQFSARYTLLLVLLAEYAVFCALKPAAFTSVPIVQTILSGQTPLLVATLALTLTLVINEFDLSLGANLVMACVMMAALPARTGLPTVTVIPIVLAASALVGLINAVLVIGLEINSFIATLGVGTSLTGLAAYLSGSTILSNVSPGLQRFAGTEWLGFPLAFWYMVLIVLLLWVLYDYTPVGRYLYFIGSNREAATFSGIPTSAYRTFAFVASALLIGFAGLLQAGTLGSSDPSAGPSFLLPAFAAGFLGATAVKVGRFNAWGTVIAAYLLITGITGLATLGLSGWVQDAFYGGALLVALVTARLTRKTVGTD
jgi:ribose transport system permease protein